MDCFLVSAAVVTSEYPLVSSLSRPTTCDSAALGSVGMLHDDVCYHSNNSDWVFVGMWRAGVR